MSTFKRSIKEQFQLKFFILYLAGYIRRLIRNNFIKNIKLIKSYVR